MSWREFDLARLQEYRFVYLTASLQSVVDKPAVKVLEEFVAHGGTIIVEGPIWDFFQEKRSFFAPERHPLDRITRISGDLWPTKLTECLMTMPFQTMGWQVNLPTPQGVDILMEMNCIPVLFRRFLGRGRVYILGFDFGLLLTGFQQGVPLGGKKKLRKTHGTQQRVIEPEDTVCDPLLLDNTFPYADLFERFLYRMFSEDRPAPRWWYFPGFYKGALISTHDEEALGKDSRIEEMNEVEKSLGLRGTMFVISDRMISARWGRDGALAALGRNGLEIGLHWNRFEKPRLKVRRFKFGLHEVPLQTQIRCLQQQTGQSVRINRNHYLALGRNYGEHFEHLDRHEIGLDSTYGPNQGGRGYLFGTAYPYHGLTWDGKISKVLELPFVTQENWGGADPAFLKGLILDSDANFHQCLVILFHPHYTLTQEEGRQMWTGAMHLAKELNQWIPTMGEFYGFFQSRCESSIESTFSDGILETRVDALAENLTLRFPCRITPDRCIRSVKIDGVESEFHIYLDAWMEDAMVAIPLGSHAVTIVYER